MIRWGQSVSFHDFEVAIGDVNDRIVASGLHPNLMKLRPERPEEKPLRDFLRSTELSIHPGFTRYYLDLIIAAERPSDVVRAGRGRRQIAEPRIEHGREVAAPRAGEVRPVIAHDDVVDAEWAGVATGTHDVDEVDNSDHVVALVGELAELLVDLVDRRWLRESCGDRRPDSAGSCRDIP